MLQESDSKFLTQPCLAHTHTPTFTHINTNREILKKESEIPTITIKNLLICEQQQ